MFGPVVGGAARGLCREATVNVKWLFYGKLGVTFYRSANNNPLSIHSLRIKGADSRELMTDFILRRKMTGKKNKRKPHEGERGEDDA